MMLKPIILLLITCASSHYTLTQTIDGFSGVEGIGISHGMDYVAVGDFSGVVKIFSKKNNKLVLHQTISESSDIVWSISMTNDHWLAIGKENSPSIYVLDDSTQQFVLKQQLQNQYNVLAIQLSADHQYLTLGTRTAVVVSLHYVDGKYQEVQRLQTQEAVTSLSLTPDGKELGAATRDSTVIVYSNTGGTYVTNTTISLGTYSFTRVKISDNHKCMAVVDREGRYLAIYRRVGHDLLLSQNITINQPYLSSVDMTSDCQFMVLGAQDYALYYESNGTAFTQVQQLQTDSEVLMASKINANHHFILLGSTSGTLYVYSMDSSSHLTSQ